MIKWERLLCLCAVKSSHRYVKINTDHKRISENNSRLRAVKSSLNPSPVVALVCSSGTKLVSEDRYTPNAPVKFTIRSLCTTNYSGS